MLKTEKTSTNLESSTIFECSAGTTSTPATDHPSSYYGTTQTYVPLFADSIHVRLVILPLHVGVFPTDAILFPFF